MKKKAIIVNCLEVYGRTKSLDAHRENFTVKKGRLPSSSVPLTNNQYNNVFVTTIVDNHGEKLIIGTKTFNALSTSSSRLDAQEKPDVGPTTLQFSVPNILTSNEIKNFINKRSWEHAKEISLDPMNKVIHSYDNLYQLRQVQSKFDHLSTYCRCRAASEVTDGHIYQPYTIFTLADCDNCNEASDGRIASLLFRTIALTIFEEEDRAAEEITGPLKKTFVQSLFRKCNNPNSRTAEILKLIINLYSENEKTIQTLENKQLNTQLESLALQIAPYITRANQHVSDSICQVFSNSNL